MSEISDAVQIVVVSGKMIYLFTNLTIRAALMTAKVMNTIYLSKWNGSVSFSRFRRIKGENIQFINISTEDQKILKYIEYEMKAHGILFARMPDLCGGDGRTQYVISPDDMIKFKAFLLDHAVGRHKDVKVGPISAADYAQSGITQDEVPTQELQELTDRATGKRYLNSEELSRQLPQVVNTLREQELIRAMLISDEPIKEHDKWAMYRMPDSVHAVIIPKVDILHDPETGASRAAIRARSNYIVVDLATGEQQSISGQKIGMEYRASEIRENGNFPEVLEKARNRNMENVVGYFRQNPVASHDRWEMYQIPESRQVVVIPKKDITGGYIDAAQNLIYPPIASFRSGRTYIMIDMDTGVQRLADGKEIKERLEAAGYYKEKIAVAEQMPERKTQTPRTQTEKQPLSSKETHTDIPKPKASLETTKLPYTRVTINQKMFAGMENGCYVTRIPYTQDYLYTPKEDCIMYDDQTTLSAHIYHDRYYKVEQANGTLVQVRGSEVKINYDDKTRSERKKTAAEKSIKMKKPEGKRKLSR